MAMTGVHPGKSKRRSGEQIKRPKAARWFVVAVTNSHAVFGRFLTPRFFGLNMNLQVRFVAELAFPVFAQSTLWPPA